MLQPHITLTGIPFSTFTRTIKLGLLYKGLDFDERRFNPHSGPALEGHPYGYIPSILIHGDKTKGSQDVHLCESQAIAHYLERIAPEPSLKLRAEHGVEEKMWEFISLFVCWGFPAINDQLVKARIFAETLGKAPEEAAAAAAGGVEPSRRFLALTDSLMSNDGPYFYGDYLTWADLFLFPLVADLRTDPEWKQIATPKLIKWANEMDKLQIVKDTTEGTVSVNARPAGWMDFVSFKTCN